MIAAIIAGRSKMRAMLGQLVRKGGVPRQMSAIPIVSFAIGGLRGVVVVAGLLMRKTQPAGASRQISRAQNAAFVSRIEGNGVPSLRAWLRTLTTEHLNAAAARKAQARLEAKALTRSLSSGVQGALFIRRMPVPLVELLPRK
jgi:hypothetical protein